MADICVVMQLQQACLLAELLLAVMLQHFAEGDSDPSALNRLGDNRVRPLLCLRYVRNSSESLFQSWRYVCVQCMSWHHVNSVSETVGHFFCSRDLVHLCVLPSDLVQSFLPECRLDGTCVCVQAFLSLQRTLDPTLDYLMRRQSSKSSSTDAIAQMARELKGYLSKAIRS